MYRDVPTGPIGAVEASRTILHSGVPGYIPGSPGADTDRRIRWPPRGSISGDCNMTSVPAMPDPPRLALSRRDAAAALGMSLRHFQRHVQPHLRCVYCGQLRLFPLAELQRWVDEQSWRDGTET